MDSDDEWLSELLAPSVSSNSCRDSGVWLRELLASGKAKVAASYLSL